MNVVFREIANRFSKMNARFPPVGKNSTERAFDGSLRSAVGSTGQIAPQRVRDFFYIPRLSRSTRGTGVRFVTPVRHPDAVSNTVFFFRQVHSQYWRLGEELWVTMSSKGWCEGCYSKEKTLDRPVISSPSSVVHARGLSLPASLYTSSSAKKQSPPQELGAPPP